MLSPHLAYIFPPPLAYYASPSPSLKLYVNAVLSVCCDKAGVVLMKIGGNAFVSAVLLLFCPFIAIKRGRKVAESRDVSLPTPYLFVEKAPGLMFVSKA